MALAVKTTPETTTRNPHTQLVLSSLLGAVYLLFSFGLVFAGLPGLWRALELGKVFNEFLADSLLILATIPITIGLVVLGLKLEGAHPQPGARAGAFLGALGALLILLVTIGIGNNWFASADMAPTVGGGLTLAVGVALLIGLIWMFCKPGFGKWLVQAEEAGWFHATAYKGNQGLRVRRGTVIALLGIGVCGIITLIQRQLLNSGSWELVIPFSRTVETTAQGLLDGTRTIHYATIPLLFYVNLTLPLILLVALAWFSWRVVNWPAFADFLIATEAEMNKVSWTTRKRLVQDTIVVLITLALLTLFLFVVDIFWIKILSNPIVDVLKIDPQEARQRQQQGAEW